MKIKLLSFLFVTLSAYLSAQNVVFADQNFKNAVLPFNDTNGDGEISYAEAAVPTAIFIDTNQNITNLAGVEAFTSLTFLFVKNNAVTAPLNLTQNTQLQNIRILHGSLPSVNITGLSQLKYLSVNLDYGASLDLTGKPLLEEIFVTGSPYTGGMTSINVSQNPMLKKLWISHNSLTSLDLTQNPLLEELVVQKFNNSPTSLTSVNLSQNPLLKLISLTGHPQLTSIDLTQNPQLQQVNLGGNGLTSLNLSNNPVVTYLAIDHQNFSGGINLTNQPLLETLHASDAMLSSLNLSANTNLKYLTLTNNYLTSINLSMLPQLFRFDAGNNLFTNIDLSNNPGIRYVSFLSNSQMKYINLKNGFNHMIIYQMASDYGNMPQLTGICVDNPLSPYAVLVKNAVGANVLMTSNCALLSTAETSENSRSFTIFPVPAGNTLHIQSDEKLLSYEIFSVSGQKVVGGKFNKGEKEINVSSLGKGHYILSLATEKQRYTRKFTKK